MLSVAEQNINAIKYLIQRKDQITKDARPLVQKVHTAAVKTVLHQLTDTTERAVALNHHLVAALITLYQLKEQTLKVISGFLQFILLMVLVPQVAIVTIFHLAAVLTMPLQPPATIMKAAAASIHHSAVALIITHQHLVLVTRAVFVTLINLVAAQMVLQQLKDLTNKVDYLMICVNYSLNLCFLKFRL